MAIDESARVVDSTIGDADVREFVTIHDSTVGDDCRLYERVSLKKSTVADSVDVNAGSYVENATIGSEVQIGPNCTVAGVTHALDETGMTFREDEFEAVHLNEGVFVGAGAVVNPGVEIGADAVVAAGGTVTRDVGPRQVVVGSPPEQEIIALAEWKTGNDRDVR
jgi:acetyltransferase-like isoleucine patch superfamily enzyme